MQGVRLGDRYRIESEIARGGMASVWRATDEVLRRTVAAKVLHPHLAADEQFRDRFRVEAVAAARLAHPNVVAVYDTGEHDGLPYIVMEHLAGGTLAEHLRQRRSLDPSEVARIGVEVCSALAHAHAAGIIHRDVKPGNILFSDGGHIKVADFGIAKAAFAGPDITNSGALLGTAKYLAPEQVKGDTVDHRADLYSLGVVLFESATGRAPFNGDNDLAIATVRLTQQPPRPRDLKPSVPRDLEQVILRSLKVEPSERFPSADEMGASLQEMVLGEEPSADPPTRPVPVGSFVKSEGRWLVPALLMLIIAGALVALFAVPGPREALKDLFGGGPSDPTPQPIAILDAGSYDPQGSDRTENEEDARHVFDGDRSTFWRTDYYNRANLGGLKEGVGIYVDLGSPKRLEELLVVAGEGGYTAAIRSSDDGQSWSAPGPAVTASREQAFTGDGSHRYWMLWITGLTRSSDGRWVVEIHEIVAT